MTSPAVELAPEPPTNLDAEETVLGGLLLAGTQNASGWVDRVRETGLQPAHFYRHSHAQLYALIATREDRGDPIDPISIAASLPAKTELTSDQIHKLAAIVPAISLAPHHATLIVDAHRRRQTWAVAQRIQAAALQGDVPAELAAELQQILDTPQSGPDLRPLWLDQAIHEPVPATSEYIDGVLETGVLADIVGLPYLHKSALALELAVKIAKGRGLLLGKYAVKSQAKVAYYWADDSRPQELKRIQAYAAANELAGRDLQVGFYLNPGLTLPDDLSTIKRHIRDHGYRLLVFDSLYNFADFDFVKDTGAVKHLYTALKRLCDDVEGLTIVLVDHASKPSDSNRDRDDSISSYGAVWKAAAVRCSIVVTKKGPSLFVSATGNNVKGFPKTPAYFNQERLELALAEEKEPDPEREQRIDEAVLDLVRRQPGKSTNQICRNVKGRDSDIIAAIARLADNNLIHDTYGTSAQLLGQNPAEVSNAPGESSAHDNGRRKAKTAWIPLEQAEKPLPAPDGQNTAEPPPGHGPSEHRTSAQTSSPYVVGGGRAEPEGEPKVNHDPDDIELR